MLRAHKLSLAREEGDPPPKNGAEHMVLIITLRRLCSVVMVTVHQGSSLQLSEDFIWQEKLELSNEHCFGVAYRGSRWKTASCIHARFSESPVSVVVKYSINFVMISDHQVEITVSI